MTAETVLSFVNEKGDVGKSTLAAPTPWTDPDDAPELTAEWFAKATPFIGGREVTREEFAAAARKRMGCPPAEATEPTADPRDDPDE